MMRRRIGLLSVALLLVGCGADRPSGASGTDSADPSSVRTFLGGAGDDPRYAHATSPRPFVFPADHGAHPAFRTEWWYLTGNLRDDTGRHFGFQLTFFRYALPDDDVARRSAWATNQLWMAHFAVTDTGNGRFYTDEKFARGALGLAGATTTPLRVWLDDWELLAEGNTLLPLKLRADAGRFALDLRIAPGKPLVLQGNDGLDAKGPEPGNASYYYSFTRLSAAGTLRIAGQDFAVSGAVWMDREWSTSVLGANTDGWNWFALQLDDGMDVMVYRLRERDGGTGAYSGGVLVDADGLVVARFAADDFALTPTAWWTGPTTDVRYAVGWRLVIPSRDLRLDIAPRLEAQELNVSVRYWEGAVTVSGQRGDRAVSGVGYAEHAGVMRQSAPAASE